MSKRHIPEEHLSRYRIMVMFANELESLGAHVLGLGETEDSQALLDMSIKYKKKAEDLWVDTPGPRP